MSRTRKRAVNRRARSKRAAKARANRVEQHEVVNAMRAVLGNKLVAGYDIVQID